MHISICQAIYLKVPCSCEVGATGQFALLAYMSEFRLRNFGVLIPGNSRSNHLGAEGTVKYAYTIVGTLLG